MIHTPNSDLNDLDFLANVSHEIRNPLNTIIGLSHLLKNKPSVEEQEEYIDGLLQTSENLLEIVNNMMDFSKLQSGRLRLEEKPVDLRKLVKRSLFGLQALAHTKNLELHTEVAEDLPPLLMLDSVKLSQVVINLVSNAIKFTEVGSIRVKLAAETTRNGKAIIRCSVSDTGIGIAEDKLDNIFKAFDQGDGDINLNYGGTGLGLTISKKLINMMGGELRVKSLPGKGSEFSFAISTAIIHDPELPVAEENIQACAEDLRVLLVDDNKLSRLVLEKTLEQWNIRYSSAENGLQALEKVQREEFDLVLMDLHMPIMDGFEAAKAIRELPGEKYRNLKIVALSAATDQLYQEKVLAAGITDFINKPFQPEDLLKKLRKNCRYCE